MSPLDVPSFVPSPRETRPMDPGVQDALLRQMQDDALAEQVCFEDRVLDRTSGLWAPVDRAREAELQAFMRASVDAHPQALQQARGDLEAAFKTLTAWDIDQQEILPWLETAAPSPGLGEERHDE